MNELRKDYMMPFDFQPPRAGLVEELKERDVKEATLDEMMMRPSLPDALGVCMWDQHSFTQSLSFGAPPYDPYADSFDPIPRAQWLDRSELLTLSEHASQVPYDKVASPEHKDVCCAQIAELIARDWPDVPHLVRWRRSEHVLEVRFDVTSLPSLHPVVAYMNMFAVVAYDVLRQHRLARAEGNHLWGFLANNRRVATFCFIFDAKSADSKRRTRRKRRPARPTSCAEEGHEAQRASEIRAVREEDEQRAAAEMERRRRAREALLRLRSVVGVLVQPRRGRRRGLLVSQTKAGMPADVAGLEDGDVVHEVHHTLVETLHDFNAVVAGTLPGQAMDVVYERDGAKRELSVIVGAAGLTGRELTELRATAGKGWCEDQERLARLRPATVMRLPQ